MGKKWDEYEEYADSKVGSKKTKKKNKQNNKDFLNEDETKKRFDKKNATRAPWKQDPY